MSGDQLAEWKQATADLHRRQRNQRGKRRRGIATVTRAGMVRVNPTQPKETPMAGLPGSNIDNQITTTVPVEYYISRESGLPTMTVTVDLSGLADPNELDFGDLIDTGDNEITLILDGPIDDD